MQPEWIPSSKSASIRKWTEGLHKESKRMFIKDKTHGHMLFLFNENGLISINPIPPKTDPAQINDSIINAVKEHNLYGVIFLGEAWVYFPKQEKDHTAFQLLDGEMRVSDLNAEDKKEALFLRMENMDGDCLVFLDEIIRDGDLVRLEMERKIYGEDRMWFVDKE